MADANLTPLPAGHEDPDATPVNPGLDQVNAFSAFMCKVLDPLPDALLADREMERIDRRVRRDQKARDEQAWYKGYTEFRCVDLAWQALDATRIAHIYFPETFTVDVRRECAEAEARRFEVMERLFRIPAPHADALKWKRKYRLSTVGLPGALEKEGVINAVVAEREALIARDAARRCRKEA